MSRWFGLIPAALLVAVLGYVLAELFIPRDPASPDSPVVILVTTQTIEAPPP